MRTDLTRADAASELEALVQCRLGRLVRTFRLVVGKTGLRLQGHAPPYYAKQLAQHAVMEATDLPVQANEIEVYRGERG